MTRTKKTVRTTTTVKNADGSTTTTVVETVSEGGAPEADPPWVKEANERFREWAHSQHQEWEGWGR